MPRSTERFLRKIPSVDALLQDERMRDLAEGIPRAVVVDSIRSAVEETRNLLVEGQAGSTTEDSIRESIRTRARDRIRAAMGPHYRRAINATGIILHTGLGRAVLPQKALRQIAEEFSGYSVLQLDEESGKRSRRDARIESLLQQLTGTEAATVVNNNAAATSIVLNTVAQGKGVIVSRGQLIEIGGSFRLPEVMASSGARLVEVGTTNRTHPKDYEAAIIDDTAAILRVHPSNYRIRGFVAEVPLEELARIAHEHRLLLIDDVGAGSLIDLSRFGLGDEPTLAESVRVGADLVTSSADKLIGSSQGGLILGKAPLIEAVRKNPFARIVRVDKITLAVLEATLTLFLDETVALREVPTLRMLVRDLPSIVTEAQRIASTVSERTIGADVSTVDGFSQMGSGSLPEQDIPTRLVAIASEKVAPDTLAARLRRNVPPVFTRVQKDHVLIDPRTLQDGEADSVIEAIVKSLADET